MGYLHIDNLYKNQEVLLFKEVYALEKIHGTSAHLGWDEEGSNPRGLYFFAGGEPHDKFVGLFDKITLTEKFRELGEHSVVVYGEAYGGKQQGMKDTYGDSLRFVCFDVNIAGHWLSVPQAESVVKKLGLEFVSYDKIPATLAELDRFRDMPSVQAFRNGITIEKKREGIVIRPPIEVTKNNGGRIIAKHKTENFRETKTNHKAGDKLVVMQHAQEIASEWVTHMRLSHVLDKTPWVGIESTGDITKAMLEDVKREGEGEIEWSREAERAVCTAAAILFKRHVKDLSLAKSQPDELGSVSAP